MGNVHSEILTLNPKRHAGAHESRELLVRKGSSRKQKHKKNLNET